MSWRDECKDCMKKGIKKPIDCITCTTNKLDDYENKLDEQEAIMCEMSHVADIRDAVIRIKELEQKLDKAINFIKNVSQHDNSEPECGGHCLDEIIMLARDILKQIKED